MAGMKEFESKLEQIHQRHVNRIHDKYLTEVERLRAHLRDYGCHAARCDHLISDPHGCSCGWKDVRAALDREAADG